MSELLKVDLNVEEIVNDNIHLIHLSNEAIYVNTHRAFQTDMNKPFTKEQEKYYFNQGKVINKKYNLNLFAIALEKQYGHESGIGFYDSIKLRNASLIFNNKIIILPRETIIGRSDMAEPGIHMNSYTKEALIIEEKACYSYGIGSDDNMNTTLTKLFDEARKNNDLTDLAWLYCIIKLPYDVLVKSEIICYPIENELKEFRDNHIKYINS